MPADALLLHHLTNELSCLIGGRIDRVVMPTYEDVVLTIKAEKLVKLLISCNSTLPRLCIIDKTGENPDTPFGFLMHLRKHLPGGIITAVEQIPYERVIKFTILSKTNMFEEKTFYFYVELMGKFSNAILVDSSGKISDSAKHLPLDVTTRAILPGLKYELPPAQIGKTEPDEQQKFVDIVTKNYEGGSLSSFLQKNFVGFAPVSLKEAVLRSGISNDIAKINEKSAEKLYFSLQNLMDDYRPCLLKKEDKFVGFYPSPYLVEQGEFTFFPTIYEAINAYSDSFFDKVQVSSRGKKLQTIVKQHIDRCDRNRAIFANRLEECKEGENEKILGELILSNLYKIRQGDDSVTVDNYYTGETVTIPLDRALSPSMNAKKHYKKYEKMKNTVGATQKLIEENEATRDYLESLFVSLDCAVTNADFDEIEREMAAQRLIKIAKKASKQQKTGKPMEFNVDGFRVLIGKNNYQNDALVKKSQNDYLWLHTQKIHGSHAVIEGKNVPQDTINKVAAYCAYYSKAANSANVPVDYTLIKFVKKPSGAVPGKVIYTNQQTVNVTPKKPE